MLNAALQWLGTASLMAMYVVMSFFPELYPANLFLGILGGLFYFVWSARTTNKPQMIVNAAGICVCILGLIRIYS